MTVSPMARLAAVLRLRPVPRPRALGERFQLPPQRLCSCRLCCLRARVGRAHAVCVVYAHAVCAACAHVACAHAVCAHAACARVACEQALAAGMVQSAQLQAAIGRVMLTRFRLGEFDEGPGRGWEHVDESLLDSPAHRALAREAAVRAGTSSICWATVCVSRVFLCKDGTLIRERICPVGSLGRSGPQLLRRWSQRCVCAAGRAPQGVDRGGDRAVCELLRHDRRRLGQDQLLPPLVRWHSVLHHLHPRRDARGRGFARRRAALRCALPRRSLSLVTFINGGRSTSVQSSGRQ